MGARPCQRDLAPANRMGADAVATGTTARGWHVPGMRRFPEAPFALCPGTIYPLLKPIEALGFIRKAHPPFEYRKAAFCLTQEGTRQLNIS